MWRLFPAKKRWKTWSGLAHHTWQHRESWLCCVHFDLVQKILGEGRTKWSSTKSSHKQSLEFNGAVKTLSAKIWQIYKWNLSDMIKITQISMTPTTWNCFLKADAFSKERGKIGKKHYPEKMIPQKNFKFHSNFTCFLLSALPHILIVLILEFMTKTFVWSTVVLLILVNAMHVQSRALSNLTKWNEVASFHC